MAAFSDLRIIQGGFQPHNFLGAALLIMQAATIVRTILGI